MIPVPSDVRVWLATGVTDMRRGMNGLSLQVQEAFGRDPNAGDLYVFRGRRGDLIKILWHDGLGLSLYAKRLERGRFIWPSPAGGVVAITPAQLGYLLEAIDWRHPPTHLATGCGRVTQAEEGWPRIAPNLFFFVHGHLRSGSAQRHRGAEASGPGGRGRPRPSAARSR
jgi:transposase